MRKIVLVSFIALITVLTTACGSPSTATKSSAPPADTQAPSSAGNSTEVDVTLADNTINSSLTTFQAGVAYTFVIKNTGRHAHNFNINSPVSTAGSIDAALSSALLAVPQEQLGVGATATVQYTFPDTAAGQELEFSCLIRKHYEDGMKLSITVTK